MVSTSRSYARNALDAPNPKFGEALRGQVEERLNFFEVRSYIYCIPTLYL